MRRADGLDRLAAPFRVADEVIKLRVALLEDAHMEQSLQRPALARMGAVGLGEGPPRESHLKRGSFTTVLQNDGPEAPGWPWRPSRLSRSRLGLPAYAGGRTSEITARE